MTTIKELAIIFRGVIKEYTDCADFDEKAEPQSELLKDLINSLLAAKELTKKQIDYSCSPVLYNKIKWNTSAFSKACKLGQFEFAKWLRHIIAYKLFISQNEDMQNITVSDYIKLIKELKEQWSAVSAKPRMVEWFIEGRANINTEYAFRHACGNGHLEIAIWLKSQWPEINPRESQDRVFRQTCSNGHINVAKWLKTNWPDIDHTAEDNEAFQEACQHGHLDVAKWLKEEFPPNRTDMAFALEETCSRGNLDMAKWLREQFVLSHGTYMRAFNRACKNGRLEVAKWIHTLIPLITIDIDECFEETCINGHLHMAKWIKSQWPDIKYTDRIFRMVCNHGHLDVANWLKEIYPTIKIKV